MPDDDGDDGDQQGAVSDLTDSARSASCICVDRAARIVYLCRQSYARRVFESMSCIRLSALASCRKTYSQTKLQQPCSAQRVVFTVCCLFA